MAYLSLQNLKKVYNQDIVAVDGCDLQIEDGEFVTIVGPSGSGKSTLLRMVAGLEDVTQGEIYLNDQLVNNIEPQNRDVAMIFQSYALYPHMSVKENMSYGLRYTTDLSENQISDRVESTAKMLGIKDLLEKSPSNLSGGQQQRVATGRAIVREPEVFLMDEPLSNLDAKLRLQMRTELQRLQDELDTTTLYVTHDQEEALTMSDRIVVMNYGKIQQVGTPSEIYNRPSNKFVADFIGSPSMNFFDVILQEDKLVSDLITYEISDRLYESIRSNSSHNEFIMGIRPEDIEITQEAGHSMSAYVDVIEPAGSDDFLYLSNGDQEICVRISQGTSPKKGNKIYISFSEDDMHIFDRETGESVL